MTESMANPNQEDRDGKHQDSCSNIQQEPLAQGQGTAFHQPSQRRVTRAEAGGAEKQHAAVDHSEAPEQPLRHGLTLVQK